MRQNTLLIIDDEISIRESLAILFEDRGYEVFTAEDGHVGLDLFFKEEVDVVITDLKMPVMNGIEVMRTIHRTAPEIPMIVVSGAGKKQDVIQALQMGAKDYITKPIIDLDIILHVVEKVFENQRLMRENLAYKERLEKSEARYRTITEQIAEGVFTVDAKENITLANPAFCRMVGYSEERLLTMNLEQITTPDSFAAILNETRARAKGLTSRYETQLIHRDGHRVHAEFASSPAAKEWHKDQYTGAIVMARDISRRIELRKKHKQFVNHSPARHTIAICANCKKIRSENDFWQEIETAFDHLAFSHGICPQCCEQLYPDISFEDEDDACST